MIVIFFLKSKFLLGEFFGVIWFIDLVGVGNCYIKLFGVVCDGGIGGYKGIGGNVDWCYNVGVRIDKGVIFNVGVEFVGVVVIDEDNFVVYVDVFI